ncbi:MAG: DUF4340 domain-containing protein, partial [Thiotrichales bacterium]|nr:DUF4340 domain-containing protein [Thiotrichales bacterium]
MIMQNRKIIILFVVTLAVIITASVISSVRAPQTGKEKAFLYPQLENAINDISRIHLRGFETGVELARSGEQWVIASSDNYPAIFDKVRALLIQFANFRVLAEKTRRPHLYYRLSVEEPEKKGSRAIVTTLYDSNNNTVASLIIGREKTGNAVNPIPGFYGRIAGTETSLLIQGKPEVSAVTRDWFITSIVHIPSELVQEVQIEHPGEDTVLLNRSEPGQPDFYLQNIPDGKKPQSLVILNRMGAILEDMVSEEVRSLQSITWPDDTVTATISTFDGLRVRTKLAVLDGKPMANFIFEQT